MLQSIWRLLKVVDSHAHILEFGATLQLPLEGTKTINGLFLIIPPPSTLQIFTYLSKFLETVARVRNYILSNADIHSDKSKFILGGGWDHTAWPKGAWPTAVCAFPSHHHCNFNRPSCYRQILILILLFGVVPLFYRAKTVTPFGYLNALSIPVCLSQRRSMAVSSSGMHWGNPLVRIADESCFEVFTVRFRYASG